LPAVMSYWPCIWPAITVSLLIAGTNFTFSPWVLNSPSCSATKNPAESTAGTTATVRSGFSAPAASAVPRPPEHAATAKTSKPAAISGIPGTRQVLISPLARTCHVRPIVYDDSPYVKRFVEFIADHSYPGGMI